MTSATSAGQISAARPKKILIIRNAYTYDFGGGERFPVNLASELQKYRYLSTVVSRAPMLLQYADAQSISRIRGWWWSWQNFSGTRVLLVPVYIIWQLLLIGWYLSLIVRMRPAIVHPQSKDDFIAATLAGRLLGKKIVWTDHADLKYILENHSRWHKNPVGKLVYACSELASSVTLVSHSEQKLIEQQLGRPVPSNWTVIHNGISDTSVAPHQRDETEQKSVVLCTTSRLVTSKGIGELIEAFRAIHAQHPDTVLWLVGDGPESVQFHEAAGDLPAIKFVGHSDNPLSYVAAADIFIHPSYHEGFSLSILEAAMLGKPIVACNVGGNPEIVRADITGLLVSPRDADALANATLRLMNDKQLRQRLGVAARQTFVDNFEFSQIVKERFVPIYEA